MEKTILKKDDFQGPVGGRYFFLSSTSSRAGLISIFLTDSYYGTRTREWLQDETRKETGSEMVDLDKKGDFIVFSSPYDESEPKFEFSVTHETFSKILDEWEQVISEAKEYIVIEVSDNNDVHIYATDQMED